MKYVFIHHFIVPGYSMNQFNDLPVHLLAQFVRALHRYRRCQCSNPGKNDFFFQFFFSQLHKLRLLLRFALPLLHVTVRTAVRLSPWSSSSSKAGTIPTWHTLKTKQEKRSSLFSRLIFSRTYGLLIRTFMASSPCKPYRQKTHCLPVRDYVFHLMVEFYLQQGLCIYL